MPQPGGVFVILVNKNNYRLSSRLVKRNCLPPNQPPLHDIIATVDLCLFDSIVTNPHHVLYLLIPPTKSYQYNRRKKPYMYKLHWLPIAERIKFKLCLLVFHAVNGRAPSYLTELVTPVANITGRASLRSAEKHDLVVPHSRLVSSERAFSVAAPRAWNSLPVDIRLITDTKLFKKKLKTFLFNSAYHGLRQWNFVSIWTIMYYVKLATGHCVSGTHKCLINK